MLRRSSIAPLLATAVFAFASVLIGCGASPSGESEPASSSPPAEEAAKVAAPTTDDSRDGGTATPAADGPAASDHEPAPDFTLARVDGGELTLSSLRGQVVLLDFWATWCGPCRRGIPHLNSLYAEHKDEGLQILGVSVDRERGGVSGKDQVLAFMKKTKMDYPNIMGTAGVAQLYGGIRSIPTAFLIDREGRIRNRYVGLQPPAVFERDVKKLLAEGAGESASI